MIRFTKDHEWVRVQDGIATVGITDYAQQALGDVVFVEVPEAGRALEQGKDAAVVESVKAASEVYAPADGTVTEGNTRLTDNPALVNTDPMGDGWFFRMKLTDPAQLDGLLDEAAYSAYVEAL
ncbi:glycine cleavage system protein GcvH [Rhodocista pekingensis]|uniref:Glycine cleavage system H protein n=1 Tax=Rhodocista pekingensis TaxID=201185 RepID=A0ABW2KZB2_9PROT